MRLVDFLLILCVLFWTILFANLRISRLDFKDNMRNNYELYDFLNRKKVFTRPFYVNFWTGVGKLSTSFYILGFLEYIEKITNGIKMPQ